MKSRRIALAAVWGLVVCAGSLPGVARAELTLYVPPACDADPSGPEQLLRCHAPAFLAPQTDRSHNRIGSPVLRPGRLWGLRVHMDPNAPAVYGEVHRDRLADRDVLQLVYRVHFEKIPLHFSRSFFEAHKNPGLLTVVTVDEASGEPLFLTSVHTCGCYRAVIPTERAPQDWLPEEWPADRFEVYGSQLPARLPAPGGEGRLLLALKADNHRVADVRVGALPAVQKRVVLPVRPMSELRELAVEGDGDRTGSMFYGSGPLKGKVRGAWNPFEGLTVFGLVSLDPTVGMDKDFGDPEQTGTPFYTMLRFWKHGASRLDRFEVLLTELGYDVSEGDGAAE